MELLKQQNTYKVETEQAAVSLIESKKEEYSGYTVEYKTQYKTKKAKGEIVDEWYIVTITVIFG